MNGTTPRRVIPTGMKWSGGIFPSGKFYLTQVILLLGKIPPLRFAQGLNDIKVQRFYGFAYCFYNISRCPAVSSGSPRRASFPQGKLLYLVGWVPFESDGDIPGRFPGTAHRPFPTVSLVGSTIQPHRLYMQRCLAMDHRRYIAYTIHPHRLYSLLQCTFFSNFTPRNGTAPPCTLRRWRREPWCGGWVSAV